MVLGDFACREAAIHVRQQRVVSGSSFEAVGDNDLRSALRALDWLLGGDIGQRGERSLLFTGRVSRRTTFVAWTPRSIGI
jgi:hypothetical protein